MVFSDCQGKKRCVATGSGLDAVSILVQTRTLNDKQFVTIPRVMQRRPIFKLCPNYHQSHSNPARRLTTPQTMRTQETLTERMRLKLSRRERQDAKGDRALGGPS